MTHEAERIHNAAVKRGWIESAITTTLLSGVMIGMYCLAGDCTHPHAIEAAIGSACAALSIHRVVLLGIRYE